MSVVVAKSNRRPEELLVDHEGYALVVLSLQDLEDLGQKLVPDPLDDEQDHALVKGNKTRGVMREMSKRSQWVIPPETFPN